MASDYNKSIDNRTGTGEGLRGRTDAVLAAEAAQYDDCRSLDLFGLEASGQRLNEIE